MAEIPKQSPWRSRLQDERGLLCQDEEQDKQWGSETMMQRREGSVLLDMEGLSRLVDAGANSTTTPEAGSSTNLRVPMFLHKTQSGKASQRGDMKAAGDGDILLPTTTAAGSGGNRGGPAPPSAAAAADSPSPPATSAPAKFVAVVHPPVAALEAETGATASPRKAGPWRRGHGRRAAASSPWLDPRRILLFFATLSSMGTIILLYFTLSMGKVGDGDANAR